MEELNALKAAVLVYFVECEEPKFFLAVQKTKAAELREQADKIERCENATKKLKGMVKK